MFTSFADIAAAALVTLCAAGVGHIVKRGAVTDFPAYSVFPLVALALAGVALVGWTSGASLAATGTPVGLALMLLAGTVGAWASEEFDATLLVAIQAVLLAAVFVVGGNAQPIALIASTALASFAGAVLVPLNPNALVESRA